MTKKPTYEELEQRVKELEKEVIDLKKVMGTLRSEKDNGQSLFDGLARAEIGVDIVGINYDVLFQNQFLKERFGNLTGQLCYEKYMGLEEPCDFCPMIKAVRNNRVESVELTADDGRNYELLSAPLPNPDGTVDKAIEVVKDITDRKVAEERIKHLNLVLHAIRAVNQLITKEKDCDKLLQGACNNLVETRGYYNAWIVLLDEAGKFVTATESGLGEDFLPMLEHLKRGELTDCGRTALSQSDIVVTEDPSSTCADCPLAEKYSGRWAMTIRLAHDGKVYGLLSVSIAADFTAYKEEQSLFKEVAGDISFALHNMEIEKERKQAEEALRESEAEKKSILDSISDIVLFQNIDLLINWGNKAAAESVGKTQHELVGLHCYDLWHGRTEPCEDCPVIRAINTGSSQKSFMTTPDGRWWEITGECVHDRDGKTVGAIEIARDITKRKQTEEKLRESEEMFKKLFEFAPDGFYLNDLEGNLIDGNKVAQEIIGYKKEELVGSSFLKLGVLPPEEIPKAAELLIENFNGRATGPDEFILNRKDGTQVVVEIMTLPVTIKSQKVVLGIARDITERKQAEEERKKLEAQLQQAQKMEAIGTLAGGIAHDFNNILGAIIGYTEIASLQVTEDEKAKESLKEVLKAGRRARDLVKQILAFSRKGEQERIPIQISPIVKEALKLLRSSLPTTIEIHQNIESDTGIVEADPTQIHQILMNLCTNAGHAMREEGGVLEVGIRDVEVGGLDSELGHLDMTPGPYLLLTVSDTGEGMTPEILERIFDPYFTTKEKDVGTGLGLAVVHGIVKSHGGTIRAYSEPGKGTTFHVYLPRIKEAKEMVKDESRPGVIPTGQERILFIDDEPVLVDIGKQMLERLGYEVTTRTSSIEALELFRAKPDQFDLVITDMTMPNMTGDRLARELMKIRPNIPIILCTGYSGRISEENAKGMGIKAFVMKPIVLSDLANTVREVLRIDD